MSMKYLLLLPNLSNPNILQTYVGNMSFNLAKIVEGDSRFDIDSTVFQTLRQELNDYSSVLDPLNLSSYDAILAIGLRTVDKFMCLSLYNEIRKRMKPGSKLCQFSDYPVKDGRADITFSTKVTDNIPNNHHIGWAANSDMFQSSGKPVDKITIFVDHTHYGVGAYDNTEWILNQIRKLNREYEVYRIGNSGKILGLDEPIEVYDRQGLPQNVYKTLLCKSHIFFTTHAESVGLSVLEAGMAGALVVSKQGFIYPDLLDTVRHVTYTGETDLDWKHIISSINPQESQEIASNNSWSNLLNNIMRVL